MAHSFVEYQGRNLRIHDVDLTAVTCLLVDAARANTLVDESVRTRVLTWADAVRTWGPGCIDLDLDAVLPTRHAAKGFLALLSDARRALAQFGEHIPAEYLNEKLGLSGVASWQPLPARYAAQVLDELERLVQQPENL